MILNGIKNLRFQCIKFDYIYKILKTKIYNNNYLIYIYIYITMMWSQKLLDVKTNHQKIRIIHVFFSVKMFRVVDSNSIKF